MRSIIIANGSPFPGQATEEALAIARQDAFVIAVDGGGDNALRLNVKPSLIIGDLDSIKVDTLAMYREQGIEIMEFDVAKDETDLELALIEAQKRGATWIRILAAIGNRLDQTLANIYLLALPCLADVDVKIIAGKQSTWLLSAGDHPIPGAIGDTVSLLPFGGDALGISTKGLAYPLHDETLFKGPARGISNVISEADARLRLRQGRLIVIHTIGRA